MNSFELLTCAWASLTAPDHRGESLFEILIRICKVYLPIMWCRSATVLGALSINSMGRSSKNFRIQFNVYLFLVLSLPSQVSSLLTEMATEQISREIFYPYWSQIGRNLCRRIQRKMSGEAARWEWPLVADWAIGERTVSFPYPTFCWTIQSSHRLKVGAGARSLFSEIDHTSALEMQVATATYSWKFGVGPRSVNQYGYI